MKSRNVIICVLLVLLGVSTRTDVSAAKASICNKFGGNFLIAESYLRNPPQYRDGVDGAAIEHLARTLLNIPPPVAHKCSTRDPNGLYHGFHDLVIKLSQIRQLTGVDLLMTAGHAEIARGNLEAAEKLYDRAWKEQAAQPGAKDPALVNIGYAQAMLQVRLKRPKDADFIFKAALRKDSVTMDSNRPTTSARMFAFAWILDQHKDFRRAATYYRHTLARIASTPLPGNPKLEHVSQIFAHLIERRSQALRQRRIELEEDERSWELHREFLDRHLKRAK